MPTDRVAAREWLWVLAWGTVLVVLTSLPYVVGALASTPDHVFGGLVYNVVDCNSYIAKMRQGAQGEWLFTLPYTSEPHQGAFIYPFYLFLGKGAALSGLSLVCTYHLARLLCAWLLAAAVYAFLAQLTGRLAIRRLAFLLALFSSGAGWLLILLKLSPLFGDMPVDFWVPEGYLFLLSYATPHLAFGGALMFALLAMIMEAWRKNAWRWVAWAGGVGLLLTAVLPFYSAVAYAVLGGTWLVQSMCDRRANWRWLRMLLLSGLPSLPMLAYQIGVFTFDPFFSVWAAQNITRSPHILHYLLGYAFLWPLAIGGAIWAAHRADRQKTLPLVWLAIAPVLVYLPVNFQRRLLIGFQVPLAFFAALGLARYVLRPFGRLRPVRWLLRWPRYSLSGLRRWLVAAVLVFLSATHVLLVAGNSLSAWMQSPQMFHSRAELEALQWLKGYTAIQDVVLCSFETGNYIPAQAGNRVFLGHGPETVRSDEKKALVARFFDAAGDDSWRKSLLDEYSIAYVVVGPRERELGAFDLDSADYLLQVYANAEYAIYRVKR